MRTKQKLEPSAHVPASSNLKCIRVLFLKSASRWMHLAASFDMYLFEVYDDLVGAETT